MAERIIKKSSFSFIFSYLFISKLLGCLLLFLNSMEFNSIQSNPHRTSAEICGLRQSEESFHYIDKNLVRSSCQKELTPLESEEITIFVL